MQLEYTSLCRPQLKGRGAAGIKYNHFRPSNLNKQVIVSNLVDYGQSVRIKLILLVLAVRPTLLGGFINTANQKSSVLSVIRQQRTCPGFHGYNVFRCCRLPELPKSQLCLAALLLSRQLSKCVWTIWISSQ